MQTDLPYPDCRRDLGQHFPPYLRHVALLGQKAQALEDTLRDQGVTDFIREEPDKPCPNNCQGVALWLERPDLPALETMVGGLSQNISKNSRLFLLLENPAYHRARFPGDPLSLDEAHAMLIRQGWRLYACVAQLDPALEAKVPALPEEKHQQQACAVYVLIAVRSEYDPRVHAALLFDEGNPEGSFHVLNSIPESWVEDAVARYGIELEKHLALLAWAQQAPREMQIYLFARAQQYFFFLAYNRPDFPTGYQCQAAFWVLLNRADMALRTLRSFEQVYPDAGVSQQITRYGRSRSPSRSVVEIPETWQGSGSVPRVLLVMPPRPHFGLDVLYDGLCRVLGAGQVTEFPRKPSLHGAQPEHYANYPCLFEYPDCPSDEASVLDGLRAGDYDLVLWGDCEQVLARDLSRRLISAAGRAPLFLLDAVDECCSFREKTLEYLGLPAAAGYFKREMLAGWDYGPNAFPMPFAYPDGRVLSSFPVDRPHDFFWAGHRYSGLRRLYLERLEAVLNRSLDARFPQEEYSRLLRESRIGLNLFGYGFDTVRYWELPAHGVLLLSERLPIRIPYDFEDGVNAVFFDDTAELEAKLRHLLIHPEEVAVLAEAGWRHLQAHHTGSARARQLLACIGMCES
jgi:hypothetical protein